MICQLLLMLLVGQIRTVVSDDIAEDKQVEAVQSTVRISNRTRKDVGSGVVIGQVDGAVYILSAAHLADLSDDLVVDFFDKKTYPKASGPYPAYVRAQSKEQDLALIKLYTKDPLPSIAKLCPLAAVPDGKKKFVGLTVGCSDGEAPKCKIADVACSKEIKRTKNDPVVLVWEMTPAPITGRSGGPLFDKEGKLIGICSGTSEQKGYYAHAQAILDFLKKNDKPLKLGKFWE